MKRKILLCLAMSTAIMLSGCASSDYKKATELMNEKNYEEAIAVFTELGDYKDSANLITACKYGSAVLLYDSGDFKEARAKFLLLKDYKDSEKYAYDAMWEMLFEYYPSGYTDDNIIFTSDIGSVVRVSTSDDKDSIGFQIELNPSESIDTVGFNIQKDNNNDEVTVYGTNSYDGGGESELIAGTANIKLSKYNFQDKLDWEFPSFVYEDYPSFYLDTVENLYNAMFDTMMVTVYDEFSKNGLGLTLADIGFTNFHI